MRSQISAMSSASDEGPPRRYVFAGTFAAERRDRVSCFIASASQASRGLLCRPFACPGATARGDRQARIWSCSCLSLKASRTTSPADVFIPDTTSRRTSVCSSGELTLGTAANTAPQVQPPTPRPRRSGHRSCDRWPVDWRAPTLNRHHVATSVLRGNTGCQWDAIETRAWSIDRRRACKPHSHPISGICDWLFVDQRYPRIRMIIKMLQLSVEVAHLVSHRPMTTTRLTTEFGHSGKLGSVPEGSVVAGVL